MERNSFVVRPATIEEVAEDLIRQLGQSQARELALNCAKSTKSYAIRAFWLAVAERTEPRPWAD